MGDEQIENLQAELDKQIKENRALSRKLRSLEEIMARAQQIADTNTDLNAITLMEKDKQEKYIKFILNSSPDIILVFDSFHRFVYCTDIFLKLTGIPLFDVIVGRTFQDVLSPFMEDEEL